jgi:hypothetical protein
MVSAAAAILFGADPRLRPEQVSALLEQTARPIADPLHQVGAGLVDIGAALGRVEAGSIPPADFAEPNDTAAEASSLLVPGAIEATLDWRDDPVDVYRLKLRRGEAVVVRTRGAVRATATIAATSAPLGRDLRYVAPRAGTYLLRLAALRTARGAYRLAIDRG